MQVPGLGQWLGGRGLRGPGRHPALGADSKGGKRRGQGALRRTAQEAGVDASPFPAGDWSLPRCARRCCASLLARHAAGLRVCVHQRCTLRPSACGEAPRPRSWAASASSRQLCWSRLPVCIAVWPARSPSPVGSFLSAQVSRHLKATFPQRGTAVPRWSRGDRPQATSQKAPWPGEAIALVALLPAKQHVQWQAEVTVDVHACLCLDVVSACVLCRAGAGARQLAHVGQC